MGGFFKSFIYAGKGIATLLSERNFRFHLCAAAFVSFFAARFYELSRGEWAALLLTFALVLSLEAANTALEALCDKVSPEKDEQIRRCKDIAAGAVLIAAVFAVGVGVALFADMERFADIFRYFSEKWYRLAVLLAAVVAAGAFVFLPRGKR